MEYNDQWRRCDVHEDAQNATSLSCWFEAWHGIALGLTTRPVTLGPKETTDKPIVDETLARPAYIQSELGFRERLAVVVLILPLHTELPRCGCESDALSLM
ncbi:unnamed protein product [Ranitomeya imitator]|uniref:Uncharacterized protein n=1 Tax=Ranitomeya imitator TaxID=111125 RepID=A0ABN9M8A6_9NEOB|nr:unnamed protein product [Ranitomeya imitator]